MDWMYDDDDDYDDHDHDRDHAYDGYYVNADDYNNLFPSII